MMAPEFHGRACPSPDALVICLIAGIWLAADSVRAGQESFSLSWRLVTAEKTQLAGRGKLERGVAGGPWNSTAIVRSSTGEMTGRRILSLSSGAASPTSLTEVTPDDDAADGDGATTTDQAAAAGGDAEPATETEESVVEERDPGEDEAPTEPAAPAASQADEQAAATEEPESSAAKEKRIIGATTYLLEKRSGYLFAARVDTGAKSCSLHVEDLQIEDESPEMAENIGKVARFKVVNGGGEEHWIKCKIRGYVKVKTSETFERRYKVMLRLRWKDIEKEVLVTLNNRSEMEFPLLVGRNFLRNDFLVDVDMDNND